MVFRDGNQTLGLLITLYGNIWPIRIRTVPFISFIFAILNCLNFVLSPQLMDFSLPPQNTQPAQKFITMTNEVFCFFSSLPNHDVCNVFQMGNCLLLQILQSPILQALFAVAKQLWGNRTTSVLQYDSPFSPSNREL